MRRSIRLLKPDGIIHLGDHFDDGETIAQENPHIPVHQVPGNCDRYRMVRYAPTVLCYPVGGVKLFMTHGHEHHVKSTLCRLLADARAAEAQAVLYGHTHVADCHREEDGLWVMNPGACGSSGGSVGVIEINNGQITECKILYQTDLLKLEEWI